MNMNLIKLKKEYSTHMPMLIKYVQLTKGDVLEIGSGLFSTPLLHWLCRDKKLLTYENNDEYYNFAKKFRWRKHKIIKINNWNEIKIDRHWGVVFIDHAPILQRVKDVIKFKDNADYIIIHDSNERCYGYDKIYSYFKYRYDYKDCIPNTTVLSNFKPL